MVTSDILQDPYLSIQILPHQNISRSTTRKFLGYQKVTCMILPDLSGLNFTKNRSILYPHLDSKQQFYCDRHRWTPCTH